MEAMGFLASFIGVITLIQTRNSAMLSTPGGQVAHKFLLVLLAAFCEHLFMMLSPKMARDRVRKQVVIFKRKHTYVMTWLYIMCFGSFIGYSGSFPKLIVDLFGYLSGDGCVKDKVFTLGGDEATCLADGGTWETNYDYPNPDAPNGSKVAWLGAFVGSVIRPFGGIMADKYGGAKMTMIAIIWTTAAAFGQGALVNKCRQLDDPTQYYGIFIFLFLCLFLGTGKMFRSLRSGNIIFIVLISQYRVLSFGVRRIHERNHLPHNRRPLPARGIWPGPRMVLCHCLLRSIHHPCDVWDRPEGGCSRDYLLRPWRILRELSFTA